MKNLNILFLVFVFLSLLLCSCKTTYKTQNAWYLEPLEPIEPYKPEKWFDFDYWRYLENEL